MQYSFDFVNGFYDLGLFSKEDIELLVDVNQFSKDDYLKIFPQ
mgnify:CR=1 FL=1